MYVEASPNLDQGPDDAVLVRIPKDFRGKLRALEARILTAAEIQTLGESIGQMLFPESLQDAVSNNLNTIGSDLGLRIRLKLGRPALADIPWEYAWLETLQPVGFLAQNGRISMVRYEQVSGPKVDFTPLGEDSLRLAALLADPKGSADYSELHLDVEEANLRNTLSTVPGLISYFEPRATVDVLTKALATPPIHIFHFAGHGKFERTMGAKFKSFDGKGYVVLLDDAQHAWEFPVDKLVANLQGCGVRLAVLGACESARQANQNAWTGIGPALAQIGIPAVIGMQYGIRNANATQFSKGFYRALAQGESVDWAMNRGRMAINNTSLDQDERDWAVPVLYLRMRAGETEAALFRRLARADSITPPRRDIGITSSVTATHPCPNCGTAVPAGRRFCDQCGQKFCIQCNGVVSPNAKFCGSCCAPIPPP